ncbi:hypothetical protein BGZ46_000453 [Entomortierella lignicola]|nr:hypothetical protein BGZ46_000453 [Entomortierella lignicola]
MTRREITNTSKETEIATRRSARTKALPAEVKSSKTTPKITKTPKSRKNVVDSEDEIAQDQEEEEEEEEKLERRPRRGASTRSSKDAKAAPITKKPTKNGNNASGSIPVQKTVESQTEEHEEEDDEDEDEDEDEEEEESSEEEDDTGSDFEEPSSKQKAKAGAKKSRQPKASTSRIPVIKPRKSTASTPKTPKVAKASRSSKSSAQPKQSKAVNTTESDLEGDAEEESELYSAVLDSQAALDTVVADWITLYERSSDEAMLNLTNFLIRCCGCKQFVTAEDFKDTDKMVDTLEGILLRYKKTTVNFDYPIVSKAKEFKKFRKNLLEFYSRLIQKTKSDILFDGVFMDTLLDWTISLSSSTFRPVRHTATTVALNIITSLAEIDTAVKEDLDLKGRQLKTSQKQKSAQVTKQLQKEITKGKNHEESVLKWIKEIFSSVYVLRCRDVDPLVRTDCIHELGQWMVLNSKVFIDTQYLRYIGMVLSDRVATVRLEALKVLAKLYEMENQPSQLQQFTTRSTSRFVEMAISESDTSARLAAIRVATLVHKHNYLEEEDLANLGALIFGANAKVRKSLAKFVKARVWESEVEGRMANCDMIAGDGVDVRKDWIELRSLVSFLIKVCKTESESADSDAQDDERADISGTRLFDETKVGRITLAAEALWSEIEVLKNWKSIAEYLLEDHTRPVAPSSSKNGKANTVTLEDIYHLEEEEENVLLEIFIASLQMTLNPPPVPGFQKDKARIKAQQDDLANEVGRFCVDIIPKLFLKYSVDAARVRFVLTIPQLIPLNVYLDMRMLAAYEEVVDEVIKVFKKHSDPSVLSTAVMTIRAMQGYEILRSSHEAKIDALGANVVDTFLTQFSQSQDSDISDRNTLEELTLCLRRLEHLIKCTDVTVKRIRSTDQDPFEGLLKVAQRYRAVNGQDAEILISALSISFLWISWVCRDTASKYDQNADWKEEDVQDILYMQESLVRIVSDFTANNSKDIDARVRRRAFQILGDIYWLFGGDMFHASKGPNRRLLYMTCSESVQTECETFLRSELDLWNEKVREKMRSIQAARPSKTTEDGVQAENNDSDAEGSDLRENEAEALEDEKLAAAQIEQEDKYEMFGTVFSFMRQIMLKDFTMEHSTAVIARYGCFGAEYDEGVKRVVTSIKAQTTEGASKQSRDQKAETFMRVCLDSVNESSNQALQLARLLATAIKPPGFMQSTRTGIDSRLVWDLHRRGIVFSLGKIAEYQRTGDTKKNKMVKYFDVLSNIPFGTQTAANESSSILELIKEECEKGGLEVTNDDVWEPLRYYQSKLEKLIHRAAAEQATAVKKTEIAARLREEQQQQLQDVDMTIADQEQPTTEPTVETNEPLQSTNGKKRQAEDDEDEIDEEEVATEEVEGSNEVNNSSETELSRDGSVDRDIQTKESKRIRVR